LSAKKKIFYQSLIAGVVACLLYPTHQHHHVLVPCMPHLSLELGFWFIPWCWLIVVGGSNAINLTDGLDGLVGSLLVVVMAGLMGVLWLQGGMTPSSLILGLATIGACLGFLWFNGLPASIFMGDVGSLALGGMLSVFALAHHMVLFLSLMGFIFLLEMISVAIQVISFKTRGKRVFRMAPIHHHFEELGWPESKVIVRFWVITCLLVLVGMIGV
jgi:phospho-N-acetylmuramoyl-pentapeptide-transferase